MVPFFLLLDHWILKLLNCPEISDIFKIIVKASLQSCFLGFYVHVSLVKQCSWFLFFSCFFWFVSTLFIRIRCWVLDSEFFIGRTTLFMFDQSSPLVVRLQGPPTITSFHVWCYVCLLKVACELLTLMINKMMTTIPSLSTFKALRNYAFNKL